MQKLRLHVNELDEEKRIKNSIMFFNLDSHRIDCEPRCGPPKGYVENNRWQVASLTL